MEKWEGGPEVGDALIEKLVGGERTGGKRGELDLLGRGKEQTERTYEAEVDVKPSDTQRRR